MKEIQLIDGEKYKIREIMLQVMRVPSKGIDLEEMRLRCRVLEALEKADASVVSITLEDADFSVLAAALRSNQWGIADSELLRIVDSILASKTPEVSVTDGDRPKPR